MLLADFIRLKHARTSIVVTKLKGIELVFRRLLIDANLGESQSLNILYKVTTLPLEKILKISKRLLETNGIKVSGIQHNELFLGLLEAAIKASRFLRLDKLKSEKEQLDDVSEDEEDNQNMEVEKESSNDGSLLESEEEDNEITK